MAQTPNFVFEKLAQRLDELKLHIRREPANVVMAFDRHRRADEGHRLNDIGIKSSLRQKLDVAELFGLVFEDLDEEMADDFSLPLRIFDSFQSRKKATRGIHIAEALPKPFRKEARDPLCFPLAKKAIVDKNTGQTIANGALNERCHHRGIDPSAEGTDDAAIAHPLANLLNRSLNKMGHVPGWLAAADAKEKIP